MLFHAARIFRFFLLQKLNPSLLRDDQVNSPSLSSTKQIHLYCLRVLQPPESVTPQAAMLMPIAHGTDHVHPPTYNV